MKQKYYSINKAVLQTKDKIVLFSIFVASIVFLFAGYYIYTRLIYKEEVDLFKYVDVDISGVSNEASANIRITDVNDQLTNNVKYTLSKSTGISNGDVIILTATPDEDYMNLKKYVAYAFTKQYAVNDLNFYAENRTQINTDYIKNIVNSNNENVKNIIINSNNNISDVQVKNLSYYYRDGDGSKPRLSVCYVTQVDYNVYYFFNLISIPNTSYYLTVYSDFLVNNDKTIEGYNISQNFQNDLYYLPLLFRQALNNDGFVEWEI